MSKKKEKKSKKKSGSKIVKSIRNAIRVKRLSDQLARLRNSPVQAMLVARHYDDKPILEEKSATKSDNIFNAGIHRRTWGTILSTVIPTDDATESRPPSKKWSDDELRTVRLNIAKRIIDDIFGEPNHPYSVQASSSSTRVEVDEISYKSTEIDFCIIVRQNWSYPDNPDVVVVASVKNNDACATTITNIKFKAKEYNDATASLIRNLVEELHPEIVLGSSASEEICEERANTTMTPNPDVPTRQAYLRFKFFKYLNNKQRIDILTKLGALEEDSDEPMSEGIARRLFNRLVDKGKFDELETLILGTINAQEESARFDTVADEIDKIVDGKSVRESISDIVKNHDILTCEKLDEKLRAANIQM